MPKRDKSASEFAPELALLKVGACVAVVILHASVPVIFSHGATGWGDWWIGMFLNALSRFAVPVFIMISGALSLNLSATDSTSFLHRRAHRILPLTLIFVTAYLLFFHLLRGDALTINSIWQRVVMSEQYEHLYFLFLLIQLWALTPWFWLFFKGPKQHLLVNLIGLTTLVTLVWQPRQFMPLLFVPYISYYLWGGYLWKHRVNLVRHSWLAPKWLVSTYLLSALSMAIITRWLTVYQVTDNLFFLKYQSPLVMISALAIFTSSLHLTKLLQKYRPILALAQGHTLAIYLLSPAVLFIFSQLPIFRDRLAEVWTVLPLSGLCLVVGVITNSAWQRVQYWYAHALANRFSSRRSTSHLDRVNR